ncbi:acyltransferase family protein [Paenibacillus allorhizosphaerae]|uniref:Acyltransferase 3 domain-containing protein n=1 Tax=Paenibacillus allorhizosphaerae TaxID=2849866 RepID=A0ABN7TIK5_9BACL|nr:acyltransferase [Paenibacillus allorhizosphaerae]CAG7632614.1 hypothetical protein PAECIP111802_01863 [Paenibacillus allorhizosphaerae]
MNQRLEELDSLRGIAALAVVMNHVLLSFPSFFEPDHLGNQTLFVQLLKYTPLHLLWAGHPSVVFFFVLSGFVLALPFLKGNSLPFIPYLIKRVCRVYIPYSAVLSIAIIFYLFLVHSEPIAQLSRWFNSFWNVEMEWALLLNHLVLIGNYNTDAYLYTIWSLVHEMRISIFFPLLMVIVVRYGWQFNVTISLMILGTSPMLTYIFKKAASLEPHQFASYVSTFHYTAIFLIGALTAKYKSVLLHHLDRMPAWMKLFILAAGILTFTYQYWFFHSMNVIHTRLFNDMFITLGSLIFLLLGLGYNPLSKFLHTRPVQFLGRISYSLYLFHPIVLLVGPKLLYGLIPLWLIFATTFAFSIVGSYFLYKYVEVPSIHLGKKLSNAVMLASKKSKQTKEAAV